MEDKKNMVFAFTSSCSPVHLDYMDYFKAPWWIIYNRIKSMVRKKFPAM